ncbi:hypothetical protein [Biformimicrobium ophioploci]|nr:hypothetical protein [Microbulbifer sp. NKW57]
MDHTTTMRSARSFRSITKLLLTAFAVIYLSGCAATHVSKIDQLSTIDGSSEIVLMPLDVELSILTAAGLTEPQAEWTQNAVQHIKTAAREEFARRNSNLLLFDAGGLNAESTLVQLQKLHEAVGYTIRLHHYGPLKLPTKNNQIDWTLGDDIAALKEHTGADYAMFVFVRDSYASAGRVAVQLLGAVAGVGVAGGTQYGFASLVDLNSGEIVWFNQLISGSGDLRTKKAADKTVTALLKTLPSAG